MTLLVLMTMWINTARIMYLQVLGFLILCPIAQGIVDGSCPKACTCEPRERRIECNKQFWNKLPDVLRGTSYLSVKYGKFHILRKPLQCLNYSELTTLKLVQNQIHFIEDDAFECMPLLHTLVIISNLLRDIPLAAFGSIPNVSNVLLPANSFKEPIIPKLCSLPKLTRVDLLRNKLTIGPGSLDCFGLLKNLYTVSLSFNTIDGPVAEIIQPLKNVSYYIGLRSCGITSLKNDTFEGFKVKILDLALNEIRQIPRDTFRNLANLKELNLIGNKIRESHPWFEELPVEVIDIRSNPLTHLPKMTNKMQVVKILKANINKLTTGSICNLESLVVLEISNSQITIIERGTFDNLPSLVKLLLKENKIKGYSVENLLLGLVHCPSFRVLDLTKSPLYALNRTFEVFKPNKLEVLNLPWCVINKILPGTFDNFTHLKVLSLFGNHLEELHPNIFHGLVSLEILMLDHNNLATLDSTYIGLQNAPLVNLTLKRNHLMKVMVHNITTLAMIDLSYNGLMTFTDLTLQDLESLTDLNLGSNFLSTGSTCHLANLANLTKLSLRDHKATWGVLPSAFDCLSNMSNLMLLDMTGYLIGKMDIHYQIEMWTTLRLHKLGYLEISGCRIPSLFMRMFSGLPQLRVLDASNNHIPYIEPSAFRNVSQLQELDLSENLITHVKWEHFIHIPHLQSLSLAGNPLVCTCDILWVLQALMTPHLVYIPDQKGVTCNSPLEVANEEVAKLDFNILDCENQWLNTVKPIAMGLGSLLILLLLCVTWHYRWRIRYTIFLARAGLGRYEEMQEDQEYKYDAFLAYSGVDLPWIRANLLPNIDERYFGPEGFKLCLHHRDWLAGIDIAENITKSIAESRRTILLLSRDFAASYWCRFELAIAHMRLDAEGHRRSRLLVILLDNIPDELLTPRLIHILTSKTYLLWPKDPESQPHFYKTLRKSLRSEHLYS